VNAARFPMRGTVSRFIGAALQPSQRFSPLKSTALRAITQEQSIASRLQAGENFDA
jgi:hypothetical protein